MSKKVADVYDVSFTPEKGCVFVIFVMTMPRCTTSPKWCENTLANDS